MVSKQFPLVSIIMPVYNAEAYVRGSIESILLQTYSHFELLIIDDGSTDNSLSICQSFFDRRIRILQNTENKGYLKSVNKAFSECQGALITFQDADDLSVLNRIEILVTELTDDLETALCGSQCYFIRGKKKSISCYPETYDEIVSTVAQGDVAVFCGASVMLRRAVLDDVGGYRELFDRIGSEDVDWFLRIIEKYKVKNLPLPLYCYQYNSTSISKSYSLNPLKYHSADMALALYRQRKNTGVDVLTQDQKRVKDFLSSFIEPYRSDPALIYKSAGLNQLAFGHYKVFFQCGKEAFKISGWRGTNILYYANLIPFLFFNAIPEGLKKRIFSFIKRHFF